MRDRIDETDLKALVVEVSVMARRIEELEKKVDSLITVKNIGIGVLIALTAIAGGVGAFINRLLGTE